MSEEFARRTVSNIVIFTLFSGLAMKTKWRHFIVLSYNFKTHGHLTERINTSPIKIGCT